MICGAIKSNVLVFSIKFTTFTQIAVSKLAFLYQIFKTITLVTLITVKEHSLINQKTVPKDVNREKSFHYSQCLRVVCFTSNKKAIIY